MSLQDAIAAARAELVRLRAREAELLVQSGLRDTVERLTTENQGLSERRAVARERIEELTKAIAAAKEHGAELELQIKGARSRVQKLRAALDGSLR